MTQTQTYAETYTQADIKNVFEHVGSQLALIARTTNLWTIEHTTKVITDLVRLAVLEYVSRIDIVLRSANAKELRAHTWTPNYNASGGSDAPGGNIWPPTPGGSLHVVVHYSAKWTALGKKQQEDFKKSLVCTWSRSSIDTSFPELTVTSTTSYTSRKYGVERVSRERRL